MIIRTRSQIEPWWDKKIKDPHAELFALVQWLISEQGYYDDSFIHFLRMYSNRAAAAATGRSYSSAVDSGERIRLNVTKSAIDTAVATIAAERSRPLHATKRGDLEARSKMQKTDQFILGGFLALQHYQTALQVFLDGAIFGSGFERIDHVRGQLFMERVPTTDVIFDDAECKYGRPRMLYITRDVDRDWLADKYPKKRGEIKNSERLTRSFVDQAGNTDPVTAIMAYRLPESKSTPGRFTIAVDQATLADGEWRDPFPLAKWDAQWPLFGYLGMGLVEELSPIQVEINYIAQKIQKLMTLATSMVWLQKGSGIANINNRDMAVREYKGNRPPIFQTTASVSAEYFHHLDRLYARAFEIVGVSQLASQGVKPAGLDSGEALQVYHDIGTQRHKHTAQRWAQHQVDCGERLLDAGARAARAGYKVRMLSADTDGASEIDFNDIYMPRDSYTTQVFPANLLPEEPAGRIDAMLKLANVYPALGPHLIGLLRGTPDVDYLARLATAPLELIEKKIGNMLERGQPESPEPHMNFQLTLDWASKHLAQAQIDEVPEERLDLVRSFIAQTQEKIVQAEQAALQQAQMQQMMMQPTGPTMGTQPVGAAPAGPPNL